VVNGIVNFFERVYELEKNGIEPRDFNEFLGDLIKYIKEKKGIKEENPTMRLLHFLHRKHLLKNE